MHFFYILLASTTASADTCELDSIQVSGPENTVNFDYNNVPTVFMLSHETSDYQATGIVDDDEEDWIFAVNSGLARQLTLTRSGVDYLYVRLDSSGNVEACMAEPVVLEQSLSQTCAVAFDYHHEVNQSASADMRTVLLGIVASGACP